jgi:hypothetical protein
MEWIGSAEKGDPMSKNEARARFMEEREAELSAAGELPRHLMDSPAGYGEPVAQPISKQAAGQVADAEAEVEADAEGEAEADAEAEKAAKKSKRASRAKSDA